MSDVRVSVRLEELRLSFKGSESFFRKHVDGLLRNALRQAAGRKGVLMSGEAPELDAPEDSGTAASQAESPQAGSSHAGAPQGEGVLVDAVPEEERSLPEVAGFQPQSPHFAQFIRQVGNRAGNADQQVMAFGFFLWNYDKQEEFAPEHLEGCFRTLGLPAPADLEDRLAGLVSRKRFLQPGREEGSYSLSSKGVNYVKNRLLAGD